jgi:hypothetical protein
MILGSIKELCHEMTSYNTHVSIYGHPGGCMHGTRVEILKNLKAWALNVHSRKVYWLMGMAGTGKSTISQSFCEILDGMNLLSASFFCSRTSVKTSNPSFIIPSIAYALVRGSPVIKCEVIKAIKDEPKLAEPTYQRREHQFRKLVCDPVQNSICEENQMHDKVIIINTLNECPDMGFVSSLIQLILKFASNLPLKFLFASHDRDLTHNTFFSDPNLSTMFQLHKVEKDIVEDDIRKYVFASLIRIHHKNLGHEGDRRPSEADVCELVHDSDRLFIYASTTICFISDGSSLYKSRLKDIIKQESKLHTSAIDNIYGYILFHACQSKELHEIAQMRDLTLVIIFLQNPLTLHGIASLLMMDEDKILAYLSPLKSVIHIPTNDKAAVAPFHASFLDFVTSPVRGRPVNAPSQRPQTRSIRAISLPDTTVATTRDFA